MRKLILILLFLPFILKAPTLTGMADENMKRHNENMKKKFEVRDRINEIKKMDFSAQLLEEYIYLVDSSLMDVPIRQFILETGWFQSDLFKLHNNIAGMKFPRIRETKAVGTALGHAKYNHWTDSVDDYIYWREHWISKGYSTENYYKFLKDINYALSCSYEQQLKDISLKGFEPDYQKREIRNS